MDHNKLLDMLGTPGKFAKVTAVLLYLNYFPIAFNHMIMSIYGATPPHRCLVPDGSLLNESIPTLEPGDKLDSCNVYVNYSSSSGETVPCPNGWNYTLVEPESTIVNEWDLVCGQRYLWNLATSIYFAGVLLGGLIFGAISDKLGRLPVMFFCVFAPILLGVMVFLVENFPLFCMLRFLIGILMQGLQTTSFVMIMELFAAGRYRAYTAAIFEMFWATGVMTLAGLTYLIQDWRYIQLAISLPSVLVVFYAWFLPESLRWSLATKRYKKVLQYLQRVAKFNSVSLPENPLGLGQTSNLEQMELEQRDQKKHNGWDMFRTPNLRLRSIIMFYIWLATSLGYYGLALQASRLAGNKYLNFFINGAVEFPAYASGIWVLSRFGRRGPLCFYFISGGLACISAGLVKFYVGGESGFIASTVLAWVGKFCTAGCWSVIFLYAAELYPTVIRNVAVGACASWARVGSLVAPQILLVGDYTYSWVPFVIFGAVAILGGMLALVLPETRDLKLPDTIEQAEAMSRSGKGTAAMYEETALPAQEVGNGTTKHEQTELHPTEESNGTANQEDIPVFSAETSNETMEQEDISLPVADKQEDLSPPAAEDISHTAKEIPTQTEPLDDQTHTNEAFESGDKPAIDNAEAQISQF